jgi:hypothetical protein
MNLLLPPLIAAVALGAYVATLSNERSDGDDRRVAADSMVRYHEAAIRMSVGMFPTPLTINDQPAVAPFIDLLGLDSALARDTQNRLWVVTFLRAGVGTTPTIISDHGIAGIREQLQRLGFRSGTYGLWNAGTTVLASTIGPIAFSGANAPPIPQTIPDGAVMVATLCQVTQAGALDCGSDV